MGGGYDDYKHGKKKNKKIKSCSFDGDNNYKKLVSGKKLADRSSKTHSKNQTELEPNPSVIWKQVDPETTQYFSEIANLFESSGVDLEERSVICGNALEEARGKEFELATDYIISHTLQSLVEGYDVDHLCGFLQSCAEFFPLIAMDRSGSHVAETALKSLAFHIQDNDDTYLTIEDTLTGISKVIVANPVDMM